MWRWCYTHLLFLIHLPYHCRFDVCKQTVIKALVSSEMDDYIDGVRTLIAEDAMAPYYNDSHAIWGVRWQLRVRVCVPVCDCGHL